jgi:probable phosphoglycerate mutase
MKLCLVRHGETAWSISGQHTGCTDLVLTARGEEESRALAGHLRGMGITQVRVSPRLRARQTCELAGFGPGSQVEPDLAERDYGDYEGLRSADIRVGRPGWNIWRDGCPGGESPADVGARADRLIARLITAHGTIQGTSDGTCQGTCQGTVQGTGQDTRQGTSPATVALFTHGQFGAALAARWIGLAVVEGQHLALHTASVSLLGIDPRHADRRIIQLWNELPRRHLKELT